MALMRSCLRRIPLCHSQPGINWCRRQFLTHFHKIVIKRKLMQRSQHYFVQSANKINQNILSSCMDTIGLCIFTQKMWLSSEYDGNYGDHQEFHYTSVVQEVKGTDKNDASRMMEHNKKENKRVTNTKVDEVLAKYNIEEFYGIDATVQHEIQPSREELIPIPVARGLEGVFDLNEVVTVLKDENIVDVCVIKVPPDIKYVDFMVLGTGKSARHIRAAAEQFKWIWKKKRKSRDPPTLHIEGLQSSNWLAMDMGNVALHLFLKETRELYDLESLWTCGHEFDQTDDQYTVYLTSSTSLQNSKELLIEKLTQNQSTNFANMHDIEFKEDCVVDDTNFADDASYLVKKKYMTKKHAEDSMENQAGYHKVTLDQD